jgi:hypothetical protein
MSHPTDHKPEWVFGEHEDEGRTWCSVCGYATFDRKCILCGELADEATILHAPPFVLAPNAAVVVQMHAPVFEEEQ